MYQVIGEKMEQISASIGGVNIWQCQSKTTDP
jgi:hypothetical protein